MWKTAIAGLLGGLIGGVAVWVGQNGSFQLVPFGMTYAELAATLLGAVAVLLAILGLFIAVLAVLGLSQFRHLARKAAKEHIDERMQDGELGTRFRQIATEFLEVELKSGKLRTLIEDRIDFTVYGGAREVVKGEHDDDGQAGE